MNSIQKIILPEEDRIEISKVALKYPSLEVSGFLIGRCQGKTIRVDKIIFGNKEGWREKSFSLRTNLLFENETADSSRVVSVFHAHPEGSLLPSLWDIKSMIVTKIPWLIFKIKEGKMYSRGYIYHDGLINKIPIAR